jgi:opacity protein-like surface antigen
MKRKNNQVGNMAYLFRKWILKTLALASFTVPYPILFGNLYIGAFGGGGEAYRTDVDQRGFAFNNPDPRMALSVMAKGESGRFGSSLAGGRLGYEFPTCTSLTPAVEFEGFYLRSCRGEETSFLYNPTLAEHAFVDTLPLRSVTFFGNATLSYQLPFLRWLEPYIGGGIGGAIVWLSQAHSEQDSPAEPGINHFNSKTTASDSAFTVQFKGGLRFHLACHWRFFAEYRYLYIAPTTYILGFTQYPQLGHAPTSNWILHLAKLQYNIGTAGIEYCF